MKKMVDNGSSYQTSRFIASKGVGLSLDIWCSRKALTHSVCEYFEKLRFKKTKKPPKLNVYILHALPMWVHESGLYPLQPPMLLLVACNAQKVSRVNTEYIPDVRVILS